MLFKGSGVALVTPFDDKLNVNYNKLEELINFHIESKTDALIICGTTGESATLTDEEFKKIIKFTIKKAKNKIPVIVGTGSNNTKKAVEKSEFANSNGADGILVVTPYYNKCTQDGIFLHYEKINDAVNIPVILYNVPSRTGVDISIDSVLKLSKLKNIKAIKEASTDISKISKLISLVPKDFFVYSGNDDLTLPILSLGAHGVISVLANIFPSQIHNLCYNCFDNNFKKAKDIHYKYLNLMKNLFIEVNPIPVKEAMNILNYNVGDCRLPLCKMSTKNIKELKKSLV